MKKTIILVLIILLIMCCSIFAFAGTTANPYFSTVTTYLDANKVADFEAYTKEPMNTIQVTYVGLYQLTGTTWNPIASLSCPPDTSSGISYNSTRNYSSNIGSGTYKLFVTYYADGHTISRYSNTQTY